MGKENSSTAANGGKNRRNSRRLFYIKKGNGDNNNVVTKAEVKKMKFYLHDSAARKTSESFGRIKEAIILRIQKSFEDPIYLSESITRKKKKTFTKPEKTKSTLGDTAELEAEKRAENETYLEEWKIDLSVYSKV